MLRYHAEGVRFHEQGWKERYYSIKLGDAAVSDVVLSYVEGLVWVMSYYYKGVPDWSWCGPESVYAHVLQVLSLPLRSIRF